MFSARTYGGRRESVGQNRATPPSLDASDVLVIDTQHRQTVERQVVEEVEKALLEELEITAVSRQVIVVDVGNDSNERLQTRERCVAFIGFRYQVTARAETRVTASALQKAADDESWIFTPLRQDAGHQARGRGLAVSARDGNRIAEAHELGEHFRAWDDGDALLERGVDLRISSGDRARHNYDVGSLDILRRVTESYACAEARQPPRDRGGLHVGALHAITEVQQHFGDATHAASADTDEVDRVDAPHALSAVGGSAQRVLAGRGEGRGARLVIGAPLVRGSGRWSWVRFSSLMRHPPASCRHAAVSSSVA